MIDPFRVAPQLILRHRRSGNTCTARQRRGSRDHRRQTSDLPTIARARRLRVRHHPLNQVLLLFQCAEQFRNLLLLCRQSHLLPV